MQFQNEDLLLLHVRNKKSTTTNLFSFENCILRRGDIHVDLNEFSYFCFVCFLYLALLIQKVK